MDQKLGSLLERHITSVTYLSLLPRDLKSLLYKYVFKSSLKMIVIPDDQINPLKREFNREVALIIYNNDSIMEYIFDIEFMKNGGEISISVFLDRILEKDLSISRLIINRYISFVFSGFLKKIFVNTVGQNAINGPPTKFAQMTLGVTADLLEALAHIAILENL